MGQSLGLTDLQRKMENQQATLAELLKMLKPASAVAALGGPLGGADGDAAAVLASYAAQQPSLSIVKGWDALNLLGAAAPRRRKGQKVERRPEGGGGGGPGTKRDRCFGVEAYWRQLAPAQRRQLLRAPLAKMAEGAWEGREGAHAAPAALALRLLAPAPRLCLLSSCWLQPIDGCSNTCPSLPICSGAGGAGGGGCAGPG
jgi:hypothetical protein